MAWCYLLAIKEIITEHIMELHHKNGAAYISPKLCQNRIPARDLSKILQIERHLLIKYIE